MKRDLSSSLGIVPLENNSIGLTLRKKALRNDSISMQNMCYTQSLLNLFIHVYNLDRSQRAL